MLSNQVRSPRQSSNRAGSGCEEPWVSALRCEVAKVSSAIDSCCIPKIHGAEGMLSDCALRV